MISHLPKYMEDHASWIESTFTGRDKERYQFSQESLMLVTRTTKTDRWAIAVNTSSEVVKDVSFNIASEVVDANLWGEWSTSSLISRSGPVPGEFLVPDESMFLTLNVFLLHTSQRCIAAPNGHRWRGSNHFCAQHCPTSAGEILRGEVV